MKRTVWARGLKDANGKPINGGWITLEGTFDEIKDDYKTITGNDLVSGSAWKKDRLFNGVVQGNAGYIGEDIDATPVLSGSVPYSDTDDNHDE